MILQPKTYTYKYPESRQPRATPTGSTIGFINLNDDDIVYSSALGYSYQNILISDTASITAIVNTSISSNPKFTYNIVQLLLSRSFINSKAILTGSNTSYISTFKSLSDSDLVNDTTFKLGKTSIIALRKNKFGDAIRPMSFTANTSAGYTFFDCISANDTFGIIKENSTSLSAGIILYDLGLILIHGPNQHAVNSLSALTSVQFYSSYYINTLNVFCTVPAGQLNYTTNENAFYNNTITTDPENISTSTVLSSSLTALNFGPGYIQFDEASSGAFNLPSNGDFTIEAHVSASSLTSESYILFHTNAARSAGYYLSYDTSLQNLRFFANGAFGIDLFNTTNKEIIKAALSANNISNTGFVNITVTRRNDVYTLYTYWKHSNTANGTTGISQYSVTGVSNPLASFGLNSKIYLGSSANGLSLWKGMIDHVKLYKFALHPEDVLAHTKNSSLTSYTNTTSGSNTLFTVDLSLNENKVLSGIDNFITNGASGSVTGYAVSSLTSNNNYFILSTSSTVINGLSSYSNNYQWGLSATITSGKSNYFLTGMNNRDPYVTTVGLYNNYNELLAIGKLSQPIKKITNIPFTIRLNLDL